MGWFSLISGNQFLKIGPDSINILQQEGERGGEVGGRERNTERPSSFQM